MCVGEVCLAGGIRMEGGVVAPFKTFMADVPVDVWMKFKRHPLQRDTESHLKKSLHKTTGHLTNPMPHHYEVYAAVTPDGKITMLDGHTRTLGMATNRFPLPTDGLMSVIFRYAENYATSNYLYKTHDNIRAAETAKDKAAGALRWLLDDKAPTSTLLRSGGYTSAIQLISEKKHGFDIYDESIPWVDAIKLIDHYNLKYNYHMVSCGIFAAMLITFRAHGHAAYPFWKEFLLNGGLKRGNKYCGIAALGALTTTGHYKTAKRENIWKSDVLGAALFCYNLKRQNIATLEIKDIHSTKAIPVYDWKSYLNTNGDNPVCKDNAFVKVPKIVPVED